MSDQLPASLPSSRWASFDGWDYNGMKERLERSIRAINKSALLEHAKELKSQEMTMSSPFSAGQYWICFEMVAKDGSLVIARVRLPRHPDMPDTVNEDDEAYSIACEVTTMSFVKEALPDIKIPHLYAYEDKESPRAKDASAPYMLIEGFRGNSLMDTEFDMTVLPITTQERIIDQWTHIQVQLATSTFGKIGSISPQKMAADSVIGRIASAKSEGFKNCGPFFSSSEYFLAAGQAAINRFGDSDEMSFARIGARLFCDIITKTNLFHDIGEAGRFHLNHMDLGTQNILVDQNLNLVAAIDWEFAQTAPWQVNHYPMPFPLLGSGDSEDAILADPSHIAYKNVSRQAAARNLYRAGFRKAEEELARQGKALPVSFADILDSPASRIYASFTNLGRMPIQDEELVQGMARLAFGFTIAEAEEYVSKMTECV